MGIDLEKILTISASEYCLMVGKPLDAYLPKGVHGGPTGLDVPDRTEVVVNYRLKLIWNGEETEEYGAGTALIPKK